MVAIEGLNKANNFLVKKIETNQKVWHCKTIETKKTETKKQTELNTNYQQQQKKRELNPT